MNSKDITWDTTKYPSEYPELVKKIYFDISIKSRKSFAKWVGEISNKFSNDIDWWAALPASRNPYHSNLFQYACILKSLEILGKKKKIFLLL